MGIEPEKKPFTALIVDDQESICTTLRGILSDEGWDSVIAHSGKDGVRAIREGEFQLVLLDIWMKEGDGITALQEMKSIAPDVPVVMISGHGTIETAVRVTKLGAMDFLEKPLSLEKLLPIVERAEQVATAHLENVKRIGGNFQLLGESPAIALIHRQIAVVAPRNSWVLLTGENGTGKEVVARNIHLHSRRADKPFVAVNCAAIPEELIESELFGYRKGAFTNAMTSKAGKFELADGGTLFLDEIGDMSLRTQAKILRILQEQSFERLGDPSAISIDVRVVAATNKDLLKEIERGNFRQDLFYRLNVIPIHMPPLRERLADIPLLANYFLQRCAKELEEEPKVLTEPAMQALIDYQWPGNVRELKNLMERLSILCSARELTLADIPNSFQSESSEEEDRSGVDMNVGSFKEARSQFEKSFLVSSLEANSWNVSKTADSIGIERSNLHRKLKAYDIELKRK